MIAVRAIPGAGKNFIATLLSKHYNDNSLMYWDSVYNEYFHSQYLVADTNGPIKELIWDNNKWKILSGTEISNPIIVHEHELINDHLGVVKRFQAYKKSSGKIGINPEEFVENITEGFFIFGDDQETLNFLTKLIYIKVNGYRPIISYNDLTGISSITKSLESLKIQTITNGGKNNKPRDLILKANNKMSYQEWINLWKKFCIFSKKFPYSHPLSRSNLYYIDSWIKDNMLWDLFDEHKYLNFIKDNKDFHIKDLMVRDNQIVTPQTELQKLEEVRELKKKNGILLYEINYKDLFLDFKPTNTVLDHYIDEIKAYTAHNVKLINEYEDFYGKIL
jgi:hypothetical protein